MTIMEKNYNILAKKTGLYDDQINEGLEKGLEQGIEQTNIETARRMKAKGLELAIISEITGLSLAKIKKIK